MNSLGMIKKLSVAGLMVFSSFLWAGINVYEFKTPEQEARFNHLIEELRCPKCQNNNLADSNAPIAKDLKDVVYEKIMAGQSDEEITAFLKDRYGDFISYRPPVKPSTWFIWFGPFVLLIGGGWFISRYVKARKENRAQAATGSEQFASDVIQQWRQEAEANVNEQSKGE